VFKPDGSGKLVLVAIVQAADWLKRPAKTNTLYQLRREKAKPVQAPIYIKSKITLAGNLYTKEADE
jgi:hypothetical protein